MLIKMKIHPCLKRALCFRTKLTGLSFHGNSKTCSRCGLIGDREKKLFKCHTCGHVDHADSNAAFNIAKGQIIKLKSKNRLHKDRDLCKRNSDILKAEMVKSKLTVKLQVLLNEEPHKL